jgi:hypothetical protein
MKVRGKAVAVCLPGQSGVRLLRGREWPRLLWSDIRQRPLYEECRLRPGTAMRPEYLLWGALYSPVRVSATTIPSDPRPNWAAIR